MCWSRTRSTTSPTSCAWNCSLMAGRRRAVRGQDDCAHRERQPPHRRGGGRVVPERTAPAWAESSCRDLGERDALCRQGGRRLAHPRSLVRAEEDSRRSHLLTEVPPFFPSLRNFRCALPLDRDALTVAGTVPAEHQAVASLYTITRAAAETACQADRKGGSPGGTGCPGTNAVRPKGSGKSGRRARLLRRGPCITGRIPGLVPGRESTLTWAGEPMKMSGS